MVDVIFLDPGKTTLSRTKELLNHLSASNLAIHNIKISEKNHLAYFNLALKFLLSLISRRKDNVIYVISFSAKPIGIFLVPFIPFLIFMRERVIFDAGYPFNDIPNTPQLKRILMRICEVALCIASKIVLWESQEAALKFGYRFNENMTFFCLPSNKSNKSHEEKTKNYWPRHKNRKLNLLFRGNMNPESGIDDFLRYMTSQPVWHSGAVRLIIQGKNSTKLVRQIFIDDANLTLINNFLPDKELSALIESADIMIGQYGRKYSRLGTTLPHKYFEALSYDKPYLSPIYQPFNDLDPDIKQLLKKIDHSMKKQSLCLAELTEFIEVWHNKKIANAQLQTFKKKNDSIVERIDAQLQRK